MPHLLPVFLKFYIMQLFIHLIGRYSLLGVVLSGLLGGAALIAAGAMPGGAEPGGAHFLEEPLDGVGAVEGWADRTVARTRGGVGTRFPSASAFTHA